ncbi:glycosyltransferase [Neobacillus sp. MER 74]|uniref:glycosyltransferase family 2 protein n=1 Tax=Neobacillus sp. MER 74 TaxID=2939566 RepID=UPI00203EA1B2|nr:glycosyltransferase family 2 protein [Neobacillus sp. MER 74]MCM3115084.1 glycosyltransferase [Neobacillus sp. MER 74]
MEPLFSIIVPVYNVEKLITACIESVLCQSFTNFELILINDGSTDKSGRICEVYAKKDKRIKVKHVKNSGVSNARNLGVKNSTGKWLYFLDGDDTLEHNTLTSLYFNIKKYNNLDMLLGSFNYVQNGEITKAENSEDYKNGIEIVREFCLWNVKICMGSFAVSKELVNSYNIFFNESTKYGEDVEFIFYCLLNAIKVKVASDIFFNYIIHNSSSISKVNFDRYDCYKAKYRVLKYLQNKYPDCHEIHLLFKDFLLPQAIIDTTFLLCSNGVNIFKIKKFIAKNNYDGVIYPIIDNKNTPKYIRKRVKKFLKYPFMTWGECFLLQKYYNLRRNIGLLKRRIVS